MCEVCLFVCLFFFPKPRNYVCCIKVDFPFRGMFTRVSKRYERPCENVEVERGPTYTFTRDLLHIASI